MSNGWVHITVDGKPAMVRVCWVWAWADPQWREANGLPPKRPRGRKPATSTEDGRRP